MADTLYRIRSTEADEYLSEAAAQQASILRLAALLPADELSGVLEAGSWARKRIIQRMRFAALLEQVLGDED